MSRNRVKCKKGYLPGATWKDVLRNKPVTYEELQRAKPKGKKRHKKLRGAKIFFIPIGTPCEVAAPGTDKWIAHTTTVNATFTSYVPSDSGARWIFSRPDGWRMKVAVKYIREHS